MIIKPLMQIVTRINPLTGKEEAPKTPPELKQYLLLLHFIEDTNKEAKDFEIITGRKETFDYLLENIDSIDLTQSHVMSQNTPLENAITVYSFLRLCLEKHMNESEKETIDYDETMLNEHMVNFYDSMSEEELDALYEEEINQAFKPYNGEE